MKRWLLGAVLVLAGCVTRVEYVDADGGSGEVVQCEPGFTLCATAPAGVGLDAGASSYPVECADLDRDPANCGACGVSCGARSCAGGKCGACLAKGRECVADADCCGGKCTADVGGVGGCE